MTDLSIKLDDHLCFKLYVASRLVIRGYGEELAPLGLTYPKYLVLLALSEQGALTVGQLAERLSLDFGTLSPILKSLERSEFVTRTRQKDDERIVVSRLTPAGRRVVKKAMAIGYQLYCETEMEYDAFVALRDTLNDYIVRCQKVEAVKRSAPRAAKPIAKVKPRTSTSAPSRATKGL